MEHLGLSTRRPPLALGVLAAVLAIAAATGVIYPLKEIAPATSLGVVYIPGVVLVAALWGIWAHWMFLREVDELERRKYMEALVFAFTTSFLVASVSAGLQAAGGVGLDMQWVVTIMVLSWSAGYVISAWRYR